MVWVYIYLIIFIAKNELGRNLMSQSWGGLSVSTDKDRERGSYLPGCTAFMFCFTWFEMFRSLYATRHTSCKPGVGLRFASLNQWYCYVYVCNVILFWCAHIR